MHPTPSSPLPALPIPQAPTPCPQAGHSAKFDPQTLSRNPLTRRPVTPPEVKGLRFSRRKDREAFVTKLLQDTLHLQVLLQGFGE